MIITFNGLISLVAGLIWLALILFLRFKLKKSKVYLVFFTVFFVYFCGVINYTQFPIILNEDMKREIGQNVWRDMNVVPLSFSQISIKPSILNVLLTVPFGFGVSFIIKVDNKKVIWLGFLLGLLLESLQLIGALLSGFTFRYVDINDVIFNFVGVVLGYGIFKILMIYLKLYTRESTMPKNPFLQYIHDIQ